MDAQSTEATSSTTLDVYKWMDWLHKNRQKVLIGLGVAAAVGLVAGIVVWKKGQDEAHATEELFNYAPVFGSKANIDPAALLKIAGDYSDTSAGLQAQLLGADGLFNQGKYAEAQREFTKFTTDHPDSPLVPQAAIGVAASLEAQGQLADATGKYQELLTRYPAAANITSPVKLTLGRLNEEQGKFDQALKFYSDLAKSMNQYDPFASEARERQVMLMARHPELMKAIMPSSPTTPQPTMQATPPAVKMAPPAAPNAPAPATSAPAPVPAPK